VPTLHADDARAVALASAIQRGETDRLERLLRGEPGLAVARIVDAHGVARTLLHVVADWPGHFPKGADTVALLASAGAELDAAVLHSADGGSPETALHWAASSDDVAVLDALLDAGADIEAPGAMFTGGTAMSDAVVFAQWHAARRLLERGATTTIWQAAALGLVDRVREYSEREPTPTARDITNALWHACRGGQRATAEVLLASGADINWIGYDHKAPLDAAYESRADDLVQLLRTRGALRASDIG
jgi:uncharacterized protein